MEKSNQHFVNEKETDLLIKKIEIEWDFQSEQSYSDCQSIPQLSSPTSMKGSRLEKKKIKKKKKKRKVPFTKPIETNEVKRDFLSTFELDFEKQVDKDIFVQYGEFSDYISLFNQKFNRPEKKICKFSLERLSRSLKKVLVFGENLEETPELFDKPDLILNYKTQDNKLTKEKSNGIKSMTLDRNKPSHKWKRLQKSISLTPVELKKIPPGLQKFIHGDKESPFQMKALNPYQLFIELGGEDKRSVTTSSPKDILPNLNKSRGAALKSDTEDLINIISKKKNMSQKNLSHRISMATSLNRNSFLTKEISTEVSTVGKLNSQSTMNQTRVTGKSSKTLIKSNYNTSFEKKNSLGDDDDEDNYDIYDQKISNNQIENIINKFINKASPVTKNKNRFSEVINYRCSLNPQDSMKSELTRKQSEENNDSFQIKVISCGNSSSNLEIKPKRSIFSQMNNVSKQEFYSINEEDHIKEVEEEHSIQSQSIRSSLKNNRTSKSSNNNNSFLQPIKNNEEFLNLNFKTNTENESSKLFKIKSMNTKNASTSKTTKNPKNSKSGKKLKLKKKKNVREYIPRKPKLNGNDSKKTYSSNHLNPQLKYPSNHSLNSHNLQIPQSNNSFSNGHANYPNQSYPMQPHYNHFQMAPIHRYSPQQGMPMYPQPPVFMQPMYPNYPNYSMQNMPNMPPNMSTMPPNMSNMSTMPQSGGYMHNQLYPPSQQVYYNMPNGYTPSIHESNSMNSIRTQDSSNNNSNGDIKKSEINSFNK
jgi:hypothetical protein